MMTENWVNRKNKEPSDDCFFYSAGNCVGFHNCVKCDFHNLEPTKSRIIARINKELGEIKRLGKEAKRLESDSMADATKTQIKNIAYDILDKFRGVQMMNGVLNEKFGFKIPDIHSFTVKRMLKKLKNIEG